MLVENRRETILSWINNEENLTLDILFTRLDVSHMTIRRDLKWLEEKGYIRLLRGGVIRRTEGPFALANFEDRLKQNKHQKEMIARYAVKHFVSEGDIITLEGGTSVSFMAPYLSVPGLTVITNGPVILNHVAKFLENITVMCCGGILRKKEYTFVGPEAESFFARYLANKCFISAYGFTFEHGLVDDSLYEMQVKNAMIANSEEKIVLLDSNRIGASSLLPFIKPESIGVLITDPGIHPEDLERMRSLGIDVHIAEET